MHTAPVHSSTFCALELTRVVRHGLPLLLLVVVVVLCAPRGHRR